MRRRDFLRRSGRAALGLGFLPLSACSHRSQLGAQKKEPHNPIGLLIADLEERLPKMMGEANVPGLSIAVIDNARLRWRRCFGLADNGSKAPVDHDTVFQAG